MNEIASTVNGSHQPDYSKEVMAMADEVNRMLKQYPKIRIELEMQCNQLVDGDNEFERGCVEGERRGAFKMLNLANLAEERAEKQGGLNG